LKSSQLTYLNTICQQLYFFHGWCESSRNI